MNKDNLDLIESPYIISPVRTRIGKADFSFLLYNIYRTKLSALPITDSHIAVIPDFMLDSGLTLFNFLGLRQLLSNDLSIVLNIYKSWYGKPDLIELEPRDIEKIIKLSKSNPNLLRDTILLDISKKSKAFTISKIKLDINHPVYKIRRVNK